MTKPKLPIEDITEEEFKDFKDKYLDSNKLSPDAIKKIEKLFAVGRPDTGGIFCDEMHCHSYSCVIYRSPQTGIVERLVQEIDGYKSLIKDIKEKLKE